MIEDLAELRRLAAELIGPSIVPLPALRAIQRKTGSTVLKVVEAGRMTGVLALARLTAGGLEALLRDDFDPLHPRLRHYAAPREQAAALYGLGIAAATRDAARLVVEGVARLRTELGGDLDFYARAATAAGRRVLIERLGCCEIRPGLLLSQSGRRELAA